MFRQFFVNFSMNSQYFKKRLSAKIWTVIEYYLYTNLSTVLSIQLLQIIRAEMDKKRQRDRILNILLDYPLFRGTNQNMINAGSNRKLGYFNEESFEYTLYITLTIWIYVYIVQTIWIYVVHYTNHLNIRCTLHLPFESKESQDNTSCHCEARGQSRFPQRRNILDLFKLT